MKVLDTPFALDFVLISHFNLHRHILVGGVLDKACSIEAMIYSFSYGRDKLLKAKSNLEQDAFGLMNKLQATLLNDEDLTVIGAEAFHNKTGNGRGGGGDGARASVLPADISPPGTPISGAEHSYDLDGRATIHREGRDDEADSERSFKFTTKPRPETTVKKKRGTAPKKKAISSPLRFLDYAMCVLTNNCGGGNVDTHDEYDDSASTNTANSILASSSTCSTTSVNSQSTIVRAAHAWRRRNGVSESHSTSIDFRTGMSGHRGLNGDFSPHALIRQSSSYDHRHFHMSSHGALTPQRTSAARLQRRGSGSRTGRSSYV